MYKRDMLVREAVIDERPQVKTPGDVCRYVLDAHEPLRAVQEIFRAIVLYTKNEILRDALVSVGSLNASIVHPREVFMHALGCPACGRPGGASIILYHNHPTGDPAPSREDIEFTRRFAKCGEMMGVELLDHVIIGNDTFASLKELGHF